MKKCSIFKNLYDYWYLLEGTDISYCNCSSSRYYGEWVIIFEENYAYYKIKPSIVLGKKFQKFLDEKGIVRLSTEEIIKNFPSDLRKKVLFNLDFFN